MKNKKLFLLLFLAVLTLLSWNISNAWSDPYVTSYSSSYTYYDTVNVWESCRWNISNHIYQCTDGSVWQSPGDCDRIGRAPASYYGWNAFNSCTGAYICSNNGVPNPGGYWTTRQVARTGYTSGYLCHYISSVSSWSACVNETRVATAVVWSTVSGTSCTNVPTTESCNNPPVAEITNPESNLTGSGAVEYKSFVNFSGIGTDIEGDPIVGYEWCLGAPGCSSPISTSASFSYGDLPPNTTSRVFFRVRDDQGLAHWSEADSVDIAVKPTCVNASGNPSGAPAGTSFCSGDNENLSSNTTLSQVDSSADCSAPKCQYYYLPVNGEVGDAKDQIFCQRPEENLCDEGTPTPVNVSADGNYWEWTCEGKYGGTSSDGKAVKSCAYKEVNPN
ncbi:MAG: hypothetical protein ACOYS2_03180 [Patescibacteria group bacterium]